MTKEIDDKIAEMEAHKDYKVKLVRNPIKQNKQVNHDDEWRDTSHEWFITFPGGATCRYYTGLGHREWKMGGLYDRKTFNELKYKNLTDVGFERLLESSKPVKPCLKDILYSLNCDAGASRENFKDWCADCGYNDDSMKAMETYKACIQSAGLLRGLGFDVDALNVYFQDY